MRDSVWYNQPGIGLAGKNRGYIEQVLRWAHDADPLALLFYNEVEGEGMNRKSDAVYAMVKDFRKRGVPIHGVGLQMHVFDLNADATAISANISRLTALGVQVHITEMDMALPIDADGNPIEASHLSRQAEIYRAVAKSCVENSGCTAFQTWGFTDKYSWLDGFTHHKKAAGLLFDRQYKPKPAYEALRQTLSESRRR